MDAQILADGLKTQFNKAFDILAESIGLFSPPEWISGKPPYDGPARCAIHVLQCAEFYTNRSAEVWNKFGPVWQKTPDELPAQDAVAEYLQQARQMTEEWIDRLAADGLDQVDDSGQSSLERIAYALRHLQHHVGEMCVYQKQAGHEQNQWA